MESKQSPARCAGISGLPACGAEQYPAVWVGQRTRQIGVRRAIGARKIDILSYFQIENLLIAGGGAVVGALFAFGLSDWLMRHYEMMPLPPCAAWPPQMTTPRERGVVFNPNSSQF
jgi:hypothetical protein